MVSQIVILHIVNMRILTERNLTGENIFPLRIFSLTLSTSKHLLLMLCYSMWSVDRNTTNEVFIYRIASDITYPLVFISS